MSSQEEEIKMPPKKSKKDKKSSKKGKKKSKNSKKRHRESDEDYDSQDQEEQKYDQVDVDDIHLIDSKSKKFTGMMDWKETIDKVILLLLVVEAVFIFCLYDLVLWFINL